MRWFRTWQEPLESAGSWQCCARNFSDFQPSRSDCSLMGPPLGQSYWAFAKKQCCLTNSFIPPFASLSWIRQAPRLRLVLAVGFEARRLDSRSLPQSRPDGHMAKENRWQLRQTHRSMEAQDTRRRKLS